MSGTPELDQVADARRRIAVHAQFPTGYWVLYGVVLVALAGLPIWMALLPSWEYQYVNWALALVALASAAYSWRRRRSSGVYLPKRIGAYPTASRAWLVVTLVSLAGLVGIWALVRAGELGIAVTVLLPVAAVVGFGQKATRSAMVRDVEAGRVTP